jgi:hypothetical protein
VKPSKSGLVGRGFPWNLGSEDGTSARAAPVASRLHRRYLPPCGSTDASRSSNCYPKAGLFAGSRPPPELGGRLYELPRCHAIRDRRNQLGHAATGQVEDTMRDSLVRRVLSLAIAVLVLAAACTTTQARGGRVVMSQHNGWTIRVSPSLTDRWRARVQVWPPDINPQAHGGINLRFDGSATDEKSIVQSAIAAALSYIEANRRHDASWDPPWLRRLLQELGEERDN